MCIAEACRAGRAGEVRRQDDYFSRFSTKVSAIDTGVWWTALVASACVSPKDAEE